MRGNFGNMRRSAQQNDDDLHSCAKVFAGLFIAMVVIVLIGTYFLYG